MRPVASLSRPIASIVIAPTRQSKKVDLQSILNAHLFGTIAIPTIADDDRVPSQHEGMVLVGTIATDGRTHGLAIVSVGGIAHVLAVGDSINDSVLQYVYTTHIILNRRGDFEALVLPLSTTRSNATQSLTSAVDDVNPDPQTLKKLGDVILARAHIDDISGGVQGFYIEPNRVRSAFYDFGLRPGDLVIAVNGVTLIDHNRAHSESLIDELRAARQAVVTIAQRDSNSRDIVLDVSSWDPPTPTVVLANDMRH
jgi:general secretion pathway protein C